MSSYQDLPAVSADLLAARGHTDSADSARIRLLLDLLGNPQRSAPAIHITGTNGKTSTGRLIDAMLRGFGLRVGLATSPHLESVTERVCVDGHPIDAESFAEALDEIAPLAELVDERVGTVGFHELVTALGFAVFADVPVDVMVVEVGIGGRDDATNVLDAPVVVITPIDDDHAALLGGSVTSIAEHKAALITEGAIVVSAGQRPEVAAIIEARCAAVGARLLFAGRDVRVDGRTLAVGAQVVDVSTPQGHYPELVVPLLGEHQAGNVALAVAAVEAFLGGARGPVDVDAVREGLLDASSPGRLEVVRRGPTVLLDGAHNPAGAAVLARALTTDYAFTRLVAVVAAHTDKDAAGVLVELEQVVDTVVVTGGTPPDRSLGVDDLAAIAVDVFGEDRVIVAPDLPDAIEAAIEEADAADEPAGAGVIITGSLATVGAARTMLRR